MILQKFRLDNEFEILLGLIDQQKFVIKKVLFNTENDFKILKINNKKIVEGEIYYFNKEYNFQVFDLLTNSTESEIDALGIGNSLTKVNSLMVSDKKYFNLSIDNSYLTRLNLSTVDKKLYTTHFNSVPLFYKFNIYDTPIDFDNDTVIIKDLDGNIIQNYAVDTFADDHSFYFDMKNNNDYFITINDYTKQCEVIKSYYSTPHLNSFDGNKITFEVSKFIKYFAIRDLQDITDDYYLIFELENGEVLKLDTNNIHISKYYRNNDYILLSEFVKSVSLFSKTKNVNEVYNKNIDFIWFNECPLKDDNGNFVYNKFNNNPNNILFIADEFDPITEEDIINNITDDQINAMQLDKYYILSGNKLIESLDGNIYIDIQSSDLVLFSYNEMNDLKPVIDYLEFETDIIQDEHSEFYNNNFKSVSNIIKYGG